MHILAIIVGVAIFLDNLTFCDRCRYPYPAFAITSIQGYNLCGACIDHAVVSVDFWMYLKSVITSMYEQLSRLYFHDDTYLPIMGDSLFPIPLGTGNMKPILKHPNLLRFDRLKYKKK